MEAENVTIILVAIVSPTLIILGLLFLLLALAGKVLTNDKDRTRLGSALGHVSSSLGVLVLSLAGLFVMRIAAGAPPAPLEPAWLDAALRGSMGVSAVWCLVSALIAFPQLVTRFRDRPLDTYEINQAAVFGTLAQALPVIVSNEMGVIQHTTAGFDMLYGGLPGELIGKPLETIMPERYHAGHHHGMQRYIETREPHIMGTVVVIDMVQKDGTEIPVYLALNTTEVDGKPWFVASIWGKPKVEPSVLEPIVSTFSEGVADTIEHTAEDVAEVKADVKILKKHADAADVRADAADVRADVAEARADAADEREKREGAP